MCMYIYIYIYIYIHIRIFLCIYIYIHIYRERGAEVVRSVYGHIHNHTKQPFAETYLRMPQSNHLLIHSAHKMRGAEDGLVSAADAKVALAWFQDILGSSSSRGFGGLQPWPRTSALGSFRLQVCK